jgi:hypothetical protein
MRDFRDAKTMARTLRSALAPKGLTLSHSECLEITARILGAKDWNVLAALIENATAPIPEASGRGGADRWAGPLLLARDVVLFPKETLPLFIARDMSKQAVAEAGSRFWSSPRRTKATRIRGARTYTTSAPSPMCLTWRSLRPLARRPTARSS